MKKYIYSFILFLGALLSLHAQVNLALTPMKTDMVPGDPVIVKVKITNVSGQTLNLKNVGKNPWLSIHAVIGNDEDLSNLRIINSPPLKLEAGKSTTTSINVSQLYDMTREASYKLYAVVSNPTDGQNYVSNKAYINIRGGVPIWSQIVGIPKGYPGAGGSARYSVLSLSPKQGSDLYVKVEDVSSGQIVRCARLGAWERFGKPLVRVDATNKLHVLFLNTATIYAHATVDVSGKFGKFQFYKRMESTSPSLKNDANGNIFVSGAAPFDPTVRPDPIKTGDDNPFLD